jgi:hypothetical protein
MVVIERGGEEALASVVFAPSQLLAKEPGVEAAGKVVRLAADEDVARLGPRIVAAEAVPAAGLPEGSAEWLAGPDDEPAVRVAIDDGSPSAGAFIERLFPDAIRRKSPGKDLPPRGTDSSPSAQNDN